MVNVINVTACATLIFLLVLSAILAGPHLLVPVIAMTVTVFVGGLCVYAASGLMQARVRIEREWEAENPE